MQLHVLKESTWGKQAFSYYRKTAIKHTPGVTYPGAAAALTKAPRVRVGLPRPRAAWTAAADTAAAAANAPLLYSKHTHTQLITPQVSMSSENLH